MLKQIINNLSNLPGWRTNRKIIVIESDDWSSIRMPSLSTFEELSSNGLDVTSGDARRSNDNDTVDSASDLNALFETLKKLNFLIVVGIPFILLFMFMQISYIAEYTNIFVIVSPLLLLFFYDETISIKNVGKEFFNIFS
jgi:hypothetical protein